LQAAAVFAVGKAIEADAIMVQFNNEIYYENKHLVDTLRSRVETEVYQSLQNDFVTTITYDTKYSSMQNALYSIYTTIFVLFLLLVFK
jgi:hypothetical protein